MADLSTATYLKENVGPALTKAMAALAVAQPNDAVDFLGKWLLRYAETEEARIETAKQEAEFKAAREKKQAELVAEAERLKQIEDDKAAKLKARDEMIEALGTAEQWSDTTFDELVKTAKEHSNAKQVYLGWLDEEDGGGEGGDGPVIRYSHVAGPDAAQNDLMLAATLPGGAGVTMGVFEEKQPPEQGEGATEVPEGFRKFDAVWVPEVTDEAKMHYFDLTRLGSYLAVPLIYNTYYHEEALDAAILHEKETARITLENEDKKAEFEAAAAGGGDPGEGEEGGPQLQELPVKNLPGKPVKMVLCLDTLSHANSGDQKMEDLAGNGPPKDAMFVLVDAVAAARTRCEENSLSGQAKTLLLETRTKEMDEIYQNTMKSEEDTRASNTSNAILELGEEASDPDKAIVENEHKFIMARNVFNAMAGYISEMGGYVVVEKEVVATFAALLLLIGRSKSQIFIRNKDPTGLVKSISWAQLQKQVNQDMFDKVKGLNPTGPKKGLEAAQKVEFLKGLVPDIDVDKAGETKSGPAFQALLLFVKAALDYRSCDVANRKEEHLKKLREAEDTGGEAAVKALPTLESIDEDFVD